MEFTKVLYNWKKAIAKYHAIEKQIKNEKWKLNELEKKLENLKNEYEKQKTRIYALENTNFDLWIDIDLFYARKINDKEKIEKIWQKRNEYMKNRKTGACYSLLDKDIYKIVKWSIIMDAQYEKIKKQFVY